MENEKIEKILQLPICERIEIIESLWRSIRVDLCETDHYNNNPNDPSGDERRGEKGEIRKSKNK